MKKYVENFLRFKPLLSELVVRDVKIKYRKSVLGVFWTLLNPLLMMLVLSIVFSNLFRFGVENYPVYILSGQVIFNFFSESTSSAMTSILNNAQLIKKIYVPKYLFTLARIASSIINIMASFSAMLLVMILMRMELHFTMFLAIIPLLCLIILSTGVGLALATITVKFRDIMHLYSVFLTALTYLVPVIYPISLLENSPFVHKVVSLNPLTIILTMFRDLVIYGTIPSVISFVMAIVVSVMVLCTGLVVFYKNQDKFILDL